MPLLVPCPGASDPLRAAERLAVPVQIWCPSLGTLVLTLALLEAVEATAFSTLSLQLL